MSDLTFDFEDKLVKFIEENCGYNFNISITKDASGVHINTPVSIDKNAILNAVSSIEDALVDMCDFDRTEEQIVFEDEIGCYCDDIRYELKGE